MRNDPLTYRYPRTLDEAFPDRVANAYAVHHFKNRTLILATWMARTAVVGALVLFLLWAMT